LGEWKLDAAFPGHGRVNHVMRRIAVETVMITNEAAKQ